MSDLRAVKTDHASVDRRRFLKVTGAGVAGASLLTMLEARQAPAQLKGTTLRILTWSHFIPAYDVWFDKFAAQWGEKNGVKVRVDHIPHLEIPARMAADKRNIRGDESKWLRGKFVHPHDACFDADGNIYVAEWVQRGRISKLKKLA